MAKRTKTTKSPTTAPPEDHPETRREKFERIGTARMNRVLNSIRLIGNLANPTYDWTESDITKMRATIEATLTEVMIRFDRRKKIERPHFDFAHPTEEWEKAR